MTTQRCLAIDVSRGAMHDGPGIRTTVFLKGCPLSCRWCQNPEGMRLAQEIWWERRKCIGCGACLAVCAPKALHAGEGGIEIDRALCDACGLCVRACPSGAMAQVGGVWTLDELIQEVMRDAPYYVQSGGGVTVSGGEAMMRADFVCALFSRLKQRNISTALDTCGHAPWEAYERVLPDTDYVLYDVKMLDGEAHRRFTGQDNALILDNLLRLAARIRAGRARGEAVPTLWIRTPLIPGATATRENIRAISHYLHLHAEGEISRWEMCAFNAACVSKYDHMGLNWPYAGTKPMRQGEIDLLQAAALAGGFAQDKIFISGVIAQG